MKEDVEMQRKAIKVARAKKKKKTEDFAKVYFADPRTRNFWSLPASYCLQNTRHNIPVYSAAALASAASYKGCYDNETERQVADFRELLQPAEKVFGEGLLEPLAVGA